MGHDDHSQALHAMTAPLAVEAEVVQAAARGDKAALRSVLLGVAPAVLGAIRATVGPAHPNLDDLVQESLMAVVAALPAFRGDCSLGHFARRIAVRRAIDGLRSSYRVEKRRAELNETEPAPQSSTLLERRQQQWRTLLAELPPAQAEALLLRAVEGCSVEEIATLMDVPLETVRSRLRLAKASLRERLVSDDALADLLEEGHD